MPDCNCRSFTWIAILPLLFLLIVQGEHSSQNNMPPSKPVDYNKLYTDAVTNGIAYYQSWGLTGLGLTLLLIFAIDVKLYQRRAYTPMVFSGMFSVIIIMMFTGMFTHIPSISLPANLMQYNQTLSHGNLTK